MYNARPDLDEEDFKSTAKTIIMYQLKIEGKTK
jgi:hypothetical protein